MKMDTLQTKRILSLVRGGDYAHAGEEGAIELALDSVSKRAIQVILDVGCGLGGSAEYVRSHGWGSVIGIDANEDMIAYAEKTYRDVLHGTARAGRRRHPHAQFLLFFC